MIYLFIFLQVTVNIFSKYQIKSITVFERKKKIHINNNNLLAPYAIPKGSIFKLKLKLKNPREDFSKTLSLKSNGKVFVKKINNKLFLYEKTNFDDYIQNVIYSELKNTENINKEFLKAFYLVVKNYSLTNFKRHKNINANFCDTAHCQLYTPLKDKDYDNDPAFLKEVKNKVILYNKKPAFTPYSSSCGNLICSSNDIWNKSYPYLNKKNLKTDKETWNFKLKVKDLEKIDINFPSLEKIRPCSKNSETVRRKINMILGWNKIKSNNFTVKKSSDYYIFSGSGFGHNVGFCIKEAIELSKTGMNYREIIKFFFKGTEIR